YRCVWQRGVFGDESEPFHFSDIVGRRCTVQKFESGFEAFINTGATDIFGEYTLPVIDLGPVEWDGTFEMEVVTASRNKSYVDTQDPPFYSESIGGTIPLFPIRGKDKYAGSPEDLDDVIMLWSASSGFRDDEQMHAGAYDFCLEQRPFFKDPSTGKVKRCIM